MTIPAKDLITKILDRYELALAENAALKSMISTWPDESLSLAWEETRNRLLSDRTFLKGLRANTAELRRQVSAALQREVELGMLLGGPTNGRIN